MGRALKAARYGTASKVRTINVRIGWWKAAIQALDATFKASLAPMESDKLRRVNIRAIKHTITLEDRLLSLETGNEILNVDRRSLFGLNCFLEMHV